MSTSFTAEEIQQQPAVWEKMAARVANYREELSEFLAPLTGNPSARIILTGAGTSAFAGQMLAPFLSRELARRVEAIATTDLVSNPREYFTPDVPTLLVSFARSGNSPESVAATELADEMVEDCCHLIVTCAESGTLACEHRDRPQSFVILTPPETNDRGFAMTSSFTSMSLAVMLAFVPTISVEKLAVAGRYVLEHQSKVADLLAVPFDRVVYLGSGALAGLAREGALKMLELTAGQVGAYFDTPLGFRHGPKSLVREGVLIVVFLSGNPYTRQYDRDIVNELRDNGARVVALSTQDNVPEIEADWVIPVAGIDDAEAALPYVIFAQLLACATSLKLGLPVDNPFPGGEVNRVVQGVTIYEATTL